MPGRKARTTSTSHYTAGGRATGLEHPDRRQNDENSICLGKLRVGSAASVEPGLSMVAATLQQPVTEHHTFLGF